MVAFEDILLWTVSLPDVTLLAAEALAVAALDLRAGGWTGMAGVAVFSHEQIVRIDGRS
ncbi:MAG: hypothetical protein KDA86_26665 [Planctomycetaceae bacterium]|nr:hypothetical protein [Planctomycetaceae bacterium]